VELEPLGCLADAVGHGRLTSSRSGVSNSEKVGVVEGVFEGSCGGGVGCLTGQVGVVGDGDLGLAALIGDFAGGGAGGGEGWGGAGGGAHGGFGRAHLVRCCRRGIGRCGGRGGCWRGRGGRRSSRGRRGRWGGGRRCGGRGAWRRPKWGG